MTTGARLRAQKRPNLQLVAFVGGSGSQVAENLPALPLQTNLKGINVGGMSIWATNLQGKTSACSAFKEGSCVKSRYKPATRLEQQTSRLLPRASCGLALQPSTMVDIFVRDMDSVVSQRRKLVHWLRAMLTTTFNQQKKTGSSLPDRFQGPFKSSFRPLAWGSLAYQQEPASLRSCR